MIRLREIRKTFHAPDGTELLVLDGVNLDATPGRVFVVLGPNGRGKTTLLRICSGILRPSAGEVTNNGNVVSPVGMGYLDQNFRRSLFPWLTVRGNMTLARKRRFPAERALLRFGIADLADRFAFAISGGQAQLVALARAMNMPGPLILDEPHSALDLRRAFDVSLIIREETVREARSCIVTTHHLDLGLLLADDVLVLPSSQSKSPVMFRVDFRERSKDLLASADFRHVRLQILEAMFE